MKIQELRIGNKVLYNGIECEIDSIGSWNIEVAGQDFHYSSPIEQLMPVPLTEQHLIDFGFEKWFYYENYLIKETDIFDIVFNIITQEIEFYFDGVFLTGNNIKSVHQIQNILCDLEQE